MKTAKLPVPAHVFADAGTANQKGVRDCLHCPLGEDRADVHTLPETSPEVRAAEQRRIGDR